MAVVVVAAMAPATARAQDGPVTAYVDAVDAWATAARLQQLLPDSGRAGKAVRRAGRRHARVPTPTPRQLRRLRFKRRASVTERNTEQVAAQLPDVDPATVAADIERNRKLAHDAMRKLHWNRNNVADVAAYALLSAYASYKDRKSLSARGSVDVSIAESRIRIWVRDVYKFDVESARLTRHGFTSS